ncbi:hypothetical protein [Erythrobacter ani]|uniref:IrrE N-terminal-like domain-containing protein n=1 Tax=Erythrobacter ani TaxID=2827235 RepID=A0ABS6SM21_9SPHN|nr:hypothetical protein [Erythrobacter ani]MBV7266080.1 hypothetical protein [Erythrobacter ani]
MYEASIIQAIEIEDQVDRKDRPLLNAMLLARDLSLASLLRLRALSIASTERSSLTGCTGFAFPQIIQVSARLAFRAEPDEGAGFSRAYRRSAHETAHHWFGHLLGHDILDERAFLVGSLAKYVGFRVMERGFGSAPSIRSVTRNTRDDKFKKLPSLAGAVELARRRPCQTRFTSPSVFMIRSQRN